MAKIYGLFGSMTGKLADTVMSVRNGEQIARKYQPVVYNPSTPAQVAQRAKLKLLSQLSAVMAPVIAFRRDGSVSSRNLFTKKNFGKVTYASDEADITLTSIDLTGGILPIPGLNVTQSEGVLSLGLYGSAVSGIARVVYCVFAKQEDNTLRYAGSTVVSTPGEYNTFSGTFLLGTADVPALILAYGVRDNTESARVAFGNINAPTAETIAKLIVSRTLTEQDVTLTETRGIEVSLPSRKPEPEPERMSSVGSRKK